MPASRPFNPKNCDGVDVNEVVDREMARRRHVRTDKKEVDAVKFLVTSIDSILSQFQVAPKTIQRLPSVYCTIDSLTKTRSELVARMEKLATDITNASEPVADLACLEVKKKEHKKAVKKS
jgi:hypothetical protein